MMDEPDMLEAVPNAPRRPSDGHKGTFGTVMVVGGCVTMPGAPSLTARAALRSGVGLVKLATDARTLPVSLGYCASVTGVVVEGTGAERLAAIERADPPRRAVLAVGPGWGVLAGEGDDRAEFIEGLMCGPRRGVLDADGLNVLAGMPVARRSAVREAMLPGGWVWTPHPGEFRRLAEAMGPGGNSFGDPTDTAERARATAALGAASGAVVVLKGAQTVVHDPVTQRTYRQADANAVLATAGTGDVLTGLVAGLMAQEMASFEAACLGVHLHARAAASWSDRHGGSGMLAEELADALVPAMRAHRGDAGTASA